MIKHPLGSAAATPEVTLSSHPACSEPRSRREDRPVQSPQTRTQQGVDVSPATKAMTYLVDSFSGPRFLAPAESGDKQPRRLGDLAIGVQ